MSLDDEGRTIHSRDDFEQRMNQARRRARWELGDPSWAGTILGAFLYPEADAVNLAAEEKTEAGVEIEDLDDDVVKPKLEQLMRSESPW